jgi:hypothetical protein
MSINFYLSEMSASDNHGGGLTLQRVLGDDLDQIDWLIHVCRYATEIPVTRRLASKCWDLPMWPESNLSRKLIGCRPSQWLYQKRVFKKIHARNVASRIQRRFGNDGAVIRGLICPQRVDSLYCAEALSSTANIEYVTWMMDDHLVRWKGDGWEYPSSEVEGLFGRHLARAKRVFTISPVMQEFYKARFGVESEVLFGPADITENPVWERPVHGSVIRLAYFGALYKWQTDALRLLVDRLEAMGAVLDVYSSFESLPPFLARRGVVFRGRLDVKLVKSAMRSYDAVVLPASFESRLRNMSELNIATKMSECLASGTLTLLVAPPYAAMSRMLGHEEAAVLVTEDSDAAFLSAAQQLRCEPDRARLLGAARRLVESTLSTEAMRQVWLRGSASLRQSRGPISAETENSPDAPISCNERSTAS